MRGRAHGFTLIELSIVLVIIGLIMVAVFKGQSLIGVSSSQAALAAVKDLATAMDAFRDRYGYLPGDMPNATMQVPGVVANSCSVTANGNGDGNIDAGEVACVPLHLFRAGFIKGGTGTITLTVGGTNMTVRAILRTGSAANTAYPFPSSTRNLIELLNVPCQIALDLDSKTDDGNFATGNTRASVATCVPTGNAGAINDPVPAIAVAF